MKNFHRVIAASLAMACASVFAGTFNSGSTGADGAFSPTANTVVALPPNGVLNYTTVDIPLGVTVSFQRNAANTPVVILATGAVKIAGIIDINGRSGANGGLPAILGVTNKGGQGGPGGFNGGMGGAPEQNRNGGRGYGPGGGGGGSDTCGGASGGSFATAGEWQNSTCQGATYGSNAMLPVIGGAGGGGGSGGYNFDGPAGPGGGGGGGALLLISSTSVEVSGKIFAKGGAGRVSTGGGSSSSGGGSGGMVRILAPAYIGGGVIDVSGGVTSSTYAGGAGRSSIEVIPSGGSFNIAMLPTLSITSIGDVSVPTEPTGSGDVTAPLTLGNPLPVVVSATGIPVGTVVKLSLNNDSGGLTTATTSGLAGTLQSSTATGSINIPSGTSVLMASTTYTLTVAQGEALSTYAAGERVERVELAAVLGGESRVRLITISGKAYEVPAAVLAQLPA